MRREAVRVVYWACLIVLGCALAQASEEGGPPKVSIPSLSAAPALEDFLSMQPTGAAAQQMKQVTGFIQRNPHDGRPASQATTAYLGYDHKNLYVVFVCFDDPAKVRARRARREDIFDDDQVEIMIDSFHDRRRAYAFQTNPLGVQWDAIWSESTQSDYGSLSDNYHFDSSFDTLWYSRGKLTDKGYVVWMAIPFRSLRFSSDSEQTWGIILYRGILRENEDDFWPAMSLRAAGRLDRAAEASGMEGISPGRNIQLIPYGLFNSFRTLNTTDPASPHWEDRTAGGKIGLDAKFILNDSLVLDLTGNPDFSQVESDDPQVTVNQRFEVFFPEKRPFFIENSDFFRTPIDLLFTRRIADPDFGSRLSGRIGHFGLGLLMADDKSPGEIVPPSDPEFGKRAYFTVARLNHDLFHQSTVGAIFTDREFDGSFNRVGGIDARFRFSKAWMGTFQGVVSSTRLLDGTYLAGPGYKADVQRNGLNLLYEGIYNDYSPGFVTEPGFVNRVDIRQMNHSVSYRFRPKNGWLVDWGPTLITDHIWDHSGLRLDSQYDSYLVFQFKRQVAIQLEPYLAFRQRLRPADFINLGFPAPAQSEDYNEHFSSVSVSSGFFKEAVISANYARGNSINFVAAGTQPFLAFSDQASGDVTLHPVTPLKIDNTYLFSRLKDKDSGHGIFDNHIIRTKWNWQFNNELSLRFILQYDATLANQQFTYLQTTKQLSPQFLVTYLLHPGTAVYVGYNSDLQNIDPNLAVNPINGLLLRTRDRLINDNREFFVKVSYLLRF